MKNKKVISLVLAFLILFSNISPALAATFDLYHTISTDDDIKFVNFARKPSAFRKVYKDLDNYLQKHRDGKYYSLREIDNEMKAGALNSAEAIKNLQAYISLEEIGNERINGVLSSNIPQYTEELYTVESWNIFENARKELEQLRSQRFVREDILGEKIQALNIAYKELEEAGPESVLKIRTIVQTPSIVVKVGEVLSLPITIVAEMSDGSHREVEVVWQDIPSTEVSGSFKAIGSAKNIRTTISIIVEEDILVDKTKLVEAIRAGQKVSPNMFSEYSYRELAEALVDGNFVNENPSASPEEVEKTIDRIYRAIGLLVEKKPASRIVHLISPDKLIVEQGQYFEMPKTVIVVMNSGAKVQQEVVWDLILTSENLGTFSVEGTTANTNLKAIFTIEVVEAKKGIDFSGLDLAIQKANEVDRNNKSPESLARLDQALHWAETIRNSEKPSQEAIDSAKSSLNEAIDALANLLVAPTLIVTEPSRDQNLKAGDLLKIEAKGEVNGKAGFKIALPGSVNRTIIPQNMIEISPGVYTGEFVVPEGFNGTDLEVFVSLTGENGKTAFAEASGKINITQELTVRYTGLDQGDVIEKVARATNPKKIPESSKEGFFIEWTLNDSIIDPRRVEVHENLIFKANYKEIPDAWANLKFELPKGINFENGEKTEFRILKSKSLAEQGVSVPKVDSNTLPVGQKIVWDFDGGVLISTDTTLVARLEKDSDQYETYTVLVGENGKLIDEGKNSFEILKANASEENLREESTKFVKADINYVISDININSTNITVNFAEESGKWVDVVFIDDKGIEIENGNYHVTIDQSFNDAGVVAPKLEVPKGQKIDWKIGELAYIPEATINYQAEPIKIQAQFVRDDDQYKNITVKVTNPIDNLNKWEDKSFEVFVDDSENTIVEKAKAFVPGDGDYITDTAVYEYDTETVNITLKKNPEKWIDVTFVSGEFGKLYSPTTQVTNEPITVNVIKGKTLEKILSSKGIEVRAEDGYKFENWKIENQIVDLKTEIVTNSKIQADFKIDEEIWATVSFELGKNGIFEDGAKTSQKVLKTTKWSEIEVPAPKANVGYRFKGWTPELPKDNEFVETKTYTANFEFIVDEYIYRYIQVDENGGIVKDAYDRDFEVYPQAKYTGTTYKDYPNHTQPEIPNGMEIYGEVEKTEISSETGAKITKETRYYKATPEKIRELQNNLADDVEKKINIVKVQGNDMSFSFDKQKRTIYLEILNPDAETMQTLITALTGSGIFSAITSVEGAQIAKFGNEKIRLVDEKGNPRTESEIKSDMTSPVIMSEIFASFGLNEKNMQAHLDSLYRWHGNLSAVDLSGKGKNPEIFYSDRYTFEFKITDREVVFDADNKGSFVDEAKITKKLPYGKVIGQENIPKFNANDGFELKGFLASYDEYIISKDEQGNETGKVENKVDIPVSIDGLKDLIVRSKLVIKPQVEEVTKTYTVEIDGKNGSFLNPEKKTVTLNSLAAEEEVKKQALNLVKADQGYIIGDVIVENARNIVKVSFVEDTAQWATVIFDGNDFINTKELKILKNSTINENYSDIELKAEYKTITVKGWKLEGDSTNKIYFEEEIKNYKVENNTKFSLMLERKVDQIVYFDSNSYQFEKVDVSNENIILQNEGKIFKLSGDVAKKYLPNKYELVDESDYYEAKMGSDGTNFNVVVSVKEKSKVKVRFDLDGGNLNGVSDIEDYPGFSINDPGSPSKENYKFVKWVDENGEEINFPYTLSKNTVFKAVYEKINYSEGYEIGEENFEEYSIITKEYKDNSVKSIDLENVPVIKDSVDVTNESTFEFYSDSNKEEKITSLDFPNGGTTKKVFVVVNHNGNTIEKDLYIKLASVTIGKDSLTFMTIEDALAKANDGDQIVVKYNTSFASADVAEKIYGGKSQEVKAGVTLLLPFDETYSDNIEVTKSKQSSREFDRKNSFVDLTLPRRMNLIIKGTLIINASTNAGQPMSGVPYSNNYSKLITDTDSNISVESDGDLKAIGYLIGNGNLDVKSGATVLENMLVHDFRGGKRTLGFLFTKGIYDKVFPLNQISLNNIEITTKIESGANYKAFAHLNMRSTNIFETVNFIGTEAFLGLESGNIVKQYNTQNGVMTFDLNGKVAFNDLKVQILTTKDKEVPLSGLFEININSNSVVDLNANLKLLPGSNINIKSGGTLNIPQGKHIFVYDASKGQIPPKNGDGNDSYPRKSMEQNYRVIPKFNFSSTTQPNFIVDGTLNVSGSLGGKFQVGKNGSIIFATNDEKQRTVTIKEVSMNNPLPEYTEKFEEEIKQ